MPFHRCRCRFRLLVCWLRPWCSSRTALAPGAGPRNAGTEIRRSCSTRGRGLRMCKRSRNRAALFEDSCN
uniref:Putative secreted protein n=1 Tax=Anopheles darlingi TaxID=43151 RepID=A0A2M4DS57_ANODA